MTFKIFSKEEDEFLKQQLEDPLINWSKMSYLFLKKFNKYRPSIQFKKRWKIIQKQQFKIKERLRQKQIIQWSSQQIEHVITMSEKYGLNCSLIADSLGNKKPNHIRKLILSLFKKVFIRATEIRRQSNMKQHYDMKKQQFQKVALLLLKKELDEPILCDFRQLVLSLVQYNLKTNELPKEKAQFFFQYLQKIKQNTKENCACGDSDTAIEIFMWNQLQLRKLVCLYRQYGIKFKKISQQMRKIFKNTQKFTVKSINQKLIELVKTVLMNIVKLANSKQSQYKFSQINIENLAEDMINSWIYKELICEILFLLQNQELILKSAQSIWNKIMDYKNKYQRKKQQFSNLKHQFLVRVFKQTLKKQNTKITNIN